MLTRFKAEDWDPEEHSIQHQTPPIPSVQVALNVEGFQFLSLTTAKAILQGIQGVIVSHTIVSATSSIDTGSNINKLNTGKRHEIPQENNAYTYPASISHIKFPSYMLNHDFVESFDLITVAVECFAALLSLRRKPNLENIFHSSPQSANIFLQNDNENLNWKREFLWDDWHIDVVKQCIQLWQSSEPKCLSHALWILRYFSLLLGSCEALSTRSAVEFEQKSVLSPVNITDLSESPDYLPDCCEGKASRVNKNSNFTQLELPVSISDMKPYSDVGKASKDELLSHVLEVFCPNAISLLLTSLVRDLKVSDLV